MSASFKRAVRRFEEAARAHEVRGAQHPGDQPYIELEFEQAKEALLKFAPERKTR